MCCPKRRRCGLVLATCSAQWVWGRGYLQREKNPWIFPRAGGKPCNLLSDKILISKANLELKAMFVFVQGNEGERDQQLIICSQCRISGTLEAPWVTRHNCRAMLTLVCCKSGVPALTHFSPWKGAGLGFTLSFLGKQQIHKIKTVRKWEVRVEQSKPTVVSPALGLDVTSVCRRLFVSGPVLIYLFMHFILNVFQRKLEKKDLFIKPRKRAVELMFACCAWGDEMSFPAEFLVLA